MNNKELKPLTRKQKLFVDFLLNNPKASATQAVIHAYDPTSYITARSIASENLTKPSILAVLRGASTEAENVLLEVMRNSSRLKSNASHASIASSVANSVLDRVHGKATQRIEQHTSSVTLHIDLGDSLE